MGLPAVGRPAATALGLAGITSLEKVAEHTEEELLALHGVDRRRSASCARRWRPAGSRSEPADRRPPYWTGESGGGSW